MKKVLAVISVVCVMCVAGSAMASQSRDNRRPPMPPQGQRMYQGQGQGCWGQDCRGPEGRFEGRCDRGPRFTPDMPQEIRAKSAELAKLRIDLEEAMTSEPLNKAKALEVHGKMQTLENEIEAWRFSQRLERIEAFKKQRELNRNVPPANPEAIQ